MFTFEKFPVYELAVEFYESITKHYLKSYPVAPELRSQLRRAASSILFNLAEGAGKYSKKDKKNFYTIARGSVHECVSIIKVIKIEQATPEKVFKEQYNFLDQISRMLLSALINKMAQL